MNISCVICSDLFASADTVFTTPCGHIFHHVCLMQWIERSKSCPQCRNKCTERNIFRIYFNNMVNLDSTQNSTANLIESVDSLTLQIREKDQALKDLREQRQKLEDTSRAKEKQIQKLETSVSRNLQIIATMRHEMDILSGHRAIVKAIETENAELKSKLELMVTVETMLTASQNEINEVLKQNINAHDLSVMVGALRRELNSNEARKIELRKSLHLLRNDLKAEQEERRKLEEQLSCCDSEIHSLKAHLRRFERDEPENKTNSCEDIEGSESPVPSKRPRFVPKYFNESLNTPSPISQTEFQSRVAQVQESESPYLKVKASSIALSSLLKRPMQMKAATRPLTKSQSNEGFKQLSIFKNPRVAASSMPRDHNNVVYNGIGGSSKVLQSDLRDSASNLSLTSKPLTIVKKKKLSPLSFGS